MSCTFSLTVIVKSLGTVETNKMGCYFRTVINFTLFESEYYCRYLQGGGKDAEKYVEIDQFCKVFNH